MKKFKPVGKIHYDSREVNTSYNLEDLSEGRNLHRNHIIFKDENIIRVFNRICDHNGGRICEREGKLVCPMHGWEFCPETSSYKNIQVVKTEEDFTIDNDQLVVKTKSLFPKLSQKSFSKDIKITFISHACLIVETDEFSFATDPWVVGFAFASGWWPKNDPVKDWKDKLNAVDFIYISHNHPDHLNQFTLEHIRKDMLFVVPDFPSNSVLKMMQRFEFSNIQFLEFDQEYNFNDTELQFALFKSGDFRDDSGFYFTFGEFSMLSAVDSNDLNFLRLPRNITVYASSFAGGATGFPLCFETIPENQKISIMSRNKKANLSVVKKNLSKTHAKFFLPYAGFFQEAAKRDVYIKESNLKNSVNDYIEYLNEEVLDTTCYDEFLFNGASFISSQKIEREQSCISPENFYKEIFSNYSLKDSEIKEYFINSNFQDNLILYIELTDDDFSNTKLMFSVNFSKDKPEVKFDDFYWNKIKLENTSTTLNRKLHIKIRQDSFSWVINNKMPWEDLSIGFQCKIDRSPDIYNVDFWDHFTNNYIG